MYISLHTAEPNEENLEATEVTYSGYERVRLDGLPFVFRGDGLTNAKRICFPRCGRWGGHITHFAFTNTPHGPGKIFTKNKLDVSLKLSEDWQPGFAAGAVDLFPKPDVDVNYASQN